MAENPRNPEFPGDMVGRPDDEKDLAKENFKKYFEDQRNKGIKQENKEKKEKETSAKGFERPDFDKKPGWQTKEWQEEAEKRNREYWRKVRDTSGKK